MDVLYDTFSLLQSPLKGQAVHKWGHVLMVSKIGSQIKVELIEL